MSQVTLSVVFITTAIAAASNEIEWIQEPQTMLLLVGNFAFIPCVYSQNGVINPYYPNWIINNTLFPNSALPFRHYSNRTGMFIDNRNYNIPENTSYVCVLPTNINCRSSTGYLITVYHLPVSHMSQSLSASVPIGQISINTIKNLINATTTMISAPFESRPTTISDSATSINIIYSSTSLPGQNATDTTTAGLTSLPSYGIIIVVCCALGTFGIILLLLSIGLGMIIYLKCIKRKRQKDPIYEEPSAVQSVSQSYYRTENILLFVNSSYQSPYPYMIHGHLQQSNVKLTMKKNEAYQKVICRNKL